MIRSTRLSRTRMALLMGGLALLAASPGWSQSAGTAAATTTPATMPAAAPSATPAATPTVAASPTAKSEAEQAAAASAPSVSEAKQMTCRTVKITGSNLRTRKVCSTPNSQQNSGDWVRQQQDRGAIGASAVVNGGGG